MKQLFDAGNLVFNTFESKWESVNGQKFLGSSLVIGFILSIIIIELNRNHLFPMFIAKRIPVKHLVAIESAFLLLLIYEVISLIFSLAKSTTKSVGKQFEVLSLFLLRDTFKEFSHFDEPLSWIQIEPSILHIISANIGALGIFVVLIFFYKYQRHQRITRDDIERSYFIKAKKIISLILLTGFLLIVFQNAVNFILYGHSETTFETFYTVLVFSDILIILLSLRYNAGYHIAFRNSGFAVSTVMIRLSLIAPLMISALLGFGAALFALGVLIAYNYAAPVMTDKG